VYGAHAQEEGSRGPPPKIFKNLVGMGVKKFGRHTKQYFFCGKNDPKPKNPTDQNHNAEDTDVDIIKTFSPVKINQPDHVRQLNNIICKQKTQKTHLQSICLDHRNADLNLTIRFCPA